MTARNGVRSTQSASANVIRIARTVLPTLAATFGLLAAAGGAYTASAQQPAESTPAAPAALAAESLKVMDWNIQGGQGSDGVTDIQRIVSVIGAQNPDVVTLQELHDNTAVGGPNQWQVLLDAFPQYFAHFAKSDTNALGGVAGNLILSKYPIKEKLTFQLPQYPSGTTAVLRSLGGARLDVNGTDVRVYTTHLSAGVGTEATERRNRQARAVIDKVSGALMTTPMLLTGDLNVRPDNQIRPWFAAAEWIDSWTRVNANTGSGAVTHPGDGLDDSRIDYIYTTPAFDVGGARTVTTNASDHRPVIADLTVRAAPVTRTGSVLAGADSLAGWAHLATQGDGGATLRVCDNKADGWGVRAYVYRTSGGAQVLTGADGAYADQCTTFATAAGAVTSPVVKVCLYQAGVEKDCRQRQLT
ncbi:endonuclease/exonuclease/phosphatase family protein [Streptomyces sp. NPDC087851]|uniref:endonuclease/exonuclease/phosphatase family protein n=1 Tax=Streptomyces sp. NPDC087851 TaxID=3365810 RepID=UPI003800923E